jgi:hypothetical protein
MERLIGNDEGLYVHETIAATHLQADAETRVLAERQDVTLVEEKSHNLDRERIAEKLPSP